MPIGLLMGAYKPVDRLIGPLAGTFRYLLAPAFIPLLLMWLGTGEEQKIALLVIGVLFFLIIMIADVTRQVPSVYTETAQTLGLRPLQILGLVVFRASLAGYVDVFRQLLAVSWTYLVIAEIVAATDGIGAMMMRAKRFVHVDDIMAGILVIGLLGLLFDTLFKALHRSAFRYLHPN
jgi:NitT/TauT family transport system permease protein